ncbi:MAG: DUF47 family protein [Epulopiscium sp.]|jgi:uncharacterized protein Yka (UPF0111/DUF47 family)|nr:DUF47 family protein [Candidatus Epulonipiscium sp.]
MAKKNNDYFELIKKQTAYCVEASNLLEKILCNFNSESINAYKTQMHEIEHTADEVHHDILKKLSAEFITPIDQEDILHLVQIIDDITDALDEVIMDIYMYHIDVIPGRAVELSEVVNKCVKSLDEAAENLRNFKKPEKLHALLIKVNDIEIEADKIYMDAIHELFGSDVNWKTLIGVKAVYEGLENCCDLCEHAADVIEQVIIKNR